MPRAAPAQASLQLMPDSIGCVVSPWREMGAWEWLWAQPTATPTRIAALFRGNPTALPSEFVERADAENMATWVMEHMAHANMRFGVRVHTTAEYPERLLDARHPVQVLYYRGIWENIERPSVAVVGTRKPTAEGRRRAQKVTEGLIDAGYCAVSGLAAGIDTVVHETALSMRGSTIAVIGTPLDTCYPPENAALQARIAAEQLVVSEVPVFRYHHRDWRENRTWFPARNKTMSALTQATIIIEAGETSGTLIQARAAIEQGRKLLILNSCFENPAITWPHRFMNQGAIRVRAIDDVLAVLKSDDQALSD